MKKDKFEDIISIKWLFRNPKYNQQQSMSFWKRKNRSKILCYHREYNKANEVTKKIAGFCDCCQIQYTNKHQHFIGKKHQNKVKETQQTI